MSDAATLSHRREFLFLYDIRMGNPNGDPDENRPRVLPDGTFYVTDVRLKRFVRDYLKTQGQDILVDAPETGATNLTGRVQQHLREAKKNEAVGAELVRIITDSFIDARLFGSSLAFKDWKDAKPVPKTLTGAVQINHGEVIHRAQPVDIAGTSVFASAEDKTQGTFTTFFGLRYALIAFNGVANEHCARTTGATDADYETLLVALWRSVRSATSAATRTKTGQAPRLLVDVTYRDGCEFQYGTLLDYVSLSPRDGHAEEELARPADYTLDLSLLAERLSVPQVEQVRYACSPDLRFAESAGPPDGWKALRVEEDPTD